MTGTGAAVRPHAAVAAGSVVLLLLAMLAWTAPGASGGFSARITNSTGTAGTATAFTCTDADVQDRATALFEWPLTDTGATAADLSGAGRTGTHVGGTVVDATRPIACPRDAGPAWSLDGSSQYAVLGAVQPTPTAFTLEVWFSTTAAQGRLIGFGSSQTGPSVTYDRQLYVSSSGTLVFGVFPNAYRTLTSTAVVTDGAWHHAVATLSPTAGAALWLDGALVASDPATTSGQTYLTGGVLARRLRQPGHLAGRAAARLVLLHGPAALRRGPHLGAQRGAHRRPLPCRELTGAPPRPLRGRGAATPRC